MTVRHALLVAFFVCLHIGSNGYAEDPRFDLVLRNGHIADGTGNPWFAGDVGILGDRIAALGHIPRDSARREIDVTGLIVAPGFIDMHSHSDLLLLEDGGAPSKIRQGVTTEVLGEGGSAGPFQEKLGYDGWGTTGTPSFAEWGGVRRGHPALLNGVRRGHPALLNGPS